MATLDPHNSKDIQISPLFLWVIVLVVMVQGLLFMFGFYRNIRPVTKVEYVEVERLVTVPSSSAVTASPPVVEEAPRKPLAALPELPPLPRGFQQTAPVAVPNGQGFAFVPAVSDPLEERLLKKARAARVKSDMRQVALILNEALEKFPQSLHARYQLADMYEAMGIYDQAIRNYETVFAAGLSLAGPLYETAAQKLQEGFYREREYGELMAIGTIHQFQDPSITLGQQITITIPVLSAPQLAVDPSQVEVAVRIYDKMGKQVVPCLPSNTPDCTWSRDTVTWAANGEEFLVAKYYLSEDSSDSLFSSLEPRAYYGYVIELSYQGELLDQVAWPRILANKISGQASHELNEFSFEDFSEDINYDNLLLPPPLD